MSRNKNFFNMEYLDLIHAQASLTAIIHSLKLSIDEVKEKRPTATDYISGMEKHFKAMNETFLTLQESEKQIRTLREIVYNYHRENVELKSTVEKLKAQNANLFDGL
jgi:predicted RNase H-like nuclease (RuvC/YqgF family)